MMASTHCTSTAASAHGQRRAASLVAALGCAALVACGTPAEEPSAGAAAGGAGGAGDAVFGGGADSIVGADGVGTGGDTGAGADTGGGGDIGAGGDTAAGGDAAEGDAAATDGTHGGDDASADAAGHVADASADTGESDAADAASDDGGDDGEASADASGAGDGASVDAGGAGDADATVAADVKGEAKVVRFAALGDTGTASTSQYKVGKAMGAKCKAEGCDFVLMLGDNFYDTGVDDENDKQFAEKFEKPYETVDAPFYVVLGNHDYGSGGAGAEFLKKDHYINYGKKNAKWVMPDAWWHKQVEHVHFFALDSNSLLYSDVLPFIITKQLADMDAAYKASTADWKISFAHHPMRSNGPHGNAGCYEGAKAAPIPQLCGIIPVASGKGVYEAYQKLVCGRMDVHFSGHDHSRQWLDKAASTKHCTGTELIVSGGGAKTTDVETKSKGGFEFNPVHWQDADTPGFMWVRIEGDTFHGEFIDEDGKVQYTRSFVRGK